MKNYYFSFIYLSAKRSLSQTPNGFIRFTSFSLFGEAIFSTISINLRDRSASETSTIASRKSNIGWESEGMPRGRTQVKFY